MIMVSLPICFRALNKNLKKSSIDILGALFLITLIPCLMMI